MKKFKSFLFSISFFSFLSLCAFGQTVSKDKGQAQSSETWTTCYPKNYPSDGEFEVVVQCDGFVRKNESGQIVNRDFYFPTKGETKIKLRNVTSTLTYPSKEVVLDNLDKIMLFVDGAYKHEDKFIILNDYQDAKRNTCSYCTYFTKYLNGITVIFNGKNSTDFSYLMTTDNKETEKSLLDAFNLNGQSLDDALKKNNTIKQLLAQVEGFYRNQMNVFDSLNEKFITKFRITMTSFQIPTSSVLYDSDENTFDLETGILNDKIEILYSGN